MNSWKVFPFENSTFNYDGASFEKVWNDLHLGDCEPWPSDERLREAWRLFHLGEFLAAVSLSDDIGSLAHVVANKAVGIYATYLETDEKMKIELFQKAAKRAEAAILAFPENPNSYYFHAFNLGRHSQSISIIKALKQGIGGKIQKSLARTLELQPRHAEAHTAMGMYHAEIINKVGKMIGGMTYGAKEKEALNHFEIALKIVPKSPIAHIEYANGLNLLFGKKKRGEIVSLYDKASTLLPRDAMEKLDVEFAVKNRGMLI